MYLLTWSFLFDTGYMSNVNRGNTYHYKFYIPDWSSLDLASNWCKQYLVLIDVIHLMMI